MRLQKLSLVVALGFIGGLFGNDLANPGFETGDLTGLTTDNNQGWGSESHVTLINGSANSGSYYLELGVGADNAAQGYAVAFQSVSVIEGQEYTLSAYIKDVGGSLAGGDFAILKYEVYDVDGNQIAVEEIPQTGVTAYWQEFSISFTVPAGGVSANAVIGSSRWDNGGPANYGFDDVSFYTRSITDPSIYDIYDNVYQVFESFDTLGSNWYADGEGSLNLALDQDDYVQGSGAIDVNYYIPDLHGWGSFVALQTMYPEGGSLWDFSAAETLSVWLKVEEAPARPDTVFFRIQMTDLPPGASDHEVYAYENATAIDSVSDWFEIKVPLIELPSDGTTVPSDSGFTRVPDNWGQPQNDLTLNLESIRSLEFDFVTSGWDPNANLPADSGKVSLDFVTLKGNRGQDVAYFNGLAVTNTVTDMFGWGQSTIELVDGMGYEEGLNALKWVMGDEWSNGWSGAGFDLNPIDYLPRWGTDSLKFHLNTPPNLPDLKFEFQGGGGKCYYILTPEAAGGWNYYAIPLAGFVIDGDNPNFDTTAVNVLGFMANGNAVAGTEVYIGSMVTGNPYLDVLAPNPPVVTPTTASYYNYVTWQDVPNETGEKYDVYASKEPITDLSSTDVDVVAKGILEDTQSAVHYLYAPLTDQDVSYYYAVVCTDASGNQSEPGLSGLVTNTARGIPTISLTPPATVTLDGDLSEWYDSGIMPFEMGPTSNSFGTPNTVGTITDDADAYGTLFLAVDENFLYVAADIIDDSYEGWTGEGNWWEHDVFELFLGLYDQRGERHTSMERGAEPDYKFVFSEDHMFEELNGYEVNNDGSSFYFEGFNPDYAFEAKLSLDSIAGTSDDLFIALNGMRTPIEPTIHDRDNGAWEGNVVNSPINADNAWQTPEVWSYTFVGDQDGMGVKQGNAVAPEEYSLEDNYPNPFNPSTTIVYHTPEKGQVKLTVYNLLGQQVIQMVNGVQPAGVHRIILDARNLSSGMYIYRLEGKNFVKSKKMVLLK